MGPTPNPSRREGSACGVLCGRHHPQAIQSGRSVPVEYRVANKNHTQPLQSGRGVTIGCRVANKTHTQTLQNVKEVPAVRYATNKAVAAPLPCRGGAGVGSLTKSHTIDIRAICEIRGSHISCLKHVSGLLIIVSGLLIAVSGLLVSMG